MNEIVQHIPGFAWDGDPLPRAEFSTLEDLERVEFVARWKTDRHFIRFSRCDECLMVELSRPPIGEFSVVGMVRDMDALGLPQWVETEAQRASREAWNRGEHIR